MRGLLKTGNVQAVISDKKVAVPDAQDPTIVAFYNPGIITATDYYPFGMVMPNRSVDTDEYRYGYQAQLTDQELWDGAVSYKYRIEDPRIGRFFSVDPLAPEYPWNSPYAFSENRVIDGVELEGLEVFLINGTDMNTSEYMFNEDALEQFKRIGGNSIVNKDFVWGSLRNYFNTRDGQRKEGAEKLAKFVADYREKEKIDPSEPITLVGYSHGGNVAIQAAEQIEKLTGVKVQIITYATPAYNDESIEDPATNPSISKHVHIYSKSDFVQGYLAGSKTYNNGNSINYEIDLELGHVEMGDMNKNKGLGEFLRRTIGAMKNLPDFKKTKERIFPRKTPPVVHEPGPKY